jgi:hypothetical protein
VAQALGLTKTDYDLLIAAGWRPAEIALAMPQELADALQRLKVDWPAITQPDERKD